jgi:hypothetical protein
VTSTDVDNSPSLRFLCGASRRTARVTERAVRIDHIRATRDSTLTRTSNRKPLWCNEIQKSACRHGRPCLDAGRVVRPQQALETVDRSVLRRLHLRISDATVAGHLRARDSESDCISVISAIATLPLAVLSWFLAEERDVPQIASQAEECCSDRGKAVRADGFGLFQPEHTRRPSHCLPVVEAVSPVAQSGWLTRYAVRMQRLRLVRLSRRQAAARGSTVRLSGRRMPRPRLAPARTPPAPRCRMGECCCLPVRRRGDGQCRSRCAAADGDRDHHQQRHAHADRYRGGEPAQRKTAGRRPLNGSGPAQGHQSGRRTRSSNSGIVAFPQHRRGFGRPREPRLRR